MTWAHVGCVGCALLSVVTCAILLDKLGYFIGVFTLVLSMVACHVTWAVLSSTSCGRFLGYALVLFVV
jgi:hypothetical protein